jgi:hypothetical protein
MHAHIRSKLNIMFLDIIKDIRTRIRFISTNFPTFLISSVSVFVLAVPATHVDVQLEILKVSVKQ